MINKSIPISIGERIVEYDIEKAGTNALYRAGLISTAEYLRLLSLPKETASHMIGTWGIRNKEVMKTRSTYIKEAVDWFIMENKIDGNNIISIKNDAVFAKSMMPIHMKAPNGLQFIEKNTYTSYIRLNGVEIYYNSTINAVDVKGLGHGGYLNNREMIDIITYILRDLEGFRGQKRELLNTLNRLKRAYLDRRLNPEAYKMFNDRQQGYMYVHKTMKNRNIFTPVILEGEEWNDYELNIVYNLKNVIVPLIQYVVSM